jgi:hypothetical protein
MRYSLGRAGRSDGFLGESKGAWSVLVNWEQEEEEGRVAQLMGDLQIFIFIF